MECLSLLSSIVTPFLCPCLRDCSTESAVYIRDLKKNVEALRKEKGELNNLCRDVTRQVELDEQQQRKRTEEVAGWLVQVEKMLRDVDEILEKGDEEIQKRCYKSCPGWNCWSSHKIGKTISEKLKSVSDLKEEGHFNVVSYMLPRARVDEIPMEETVGSDRLYERVCSHLSDENVGIIGLYGMGGVGKTTLLKKINNDFLSRSSDFEVVIWVVVSKPASLEKVQEAVRSKLQVSDEIWKSRISEEEKAAEIWKVLKTKKFALLLDDIWARLDLLKVGIPPAGIENKSKVVFTTRSEEVCSQMKAQKLVKVECLSSEEAWDLFQKEVGKEILDSHPQIPALAKEVAEECKGLPLALIIVGRAMRSMKTPSDWEAAKGDLRKVPTEISGVEEELFCCLKFSYDRLRSDAIKSCFIYCSVFPEDHIIHHEEVVQLWIGEGFLSEADNIYEARNRGDGIIRDLKLACLLESSDEKENEIKMHDVIRDMALWIYHECGKQRNKIFVYQGVGLIEAQEDWKWNKAERMSFWKTNFGEFAQTLLTPNLRTLIVKECKELRAFPVGFFQYMLLIRVLDLSRSENLVELPVEIGNLHALEYLNLSHTGIAELPLQFSNLKKLKSLFLDETRSLTIIPPSVLSSLSSLQLIGMWGSGYSIVTKKDFLEELECLRLLNEISIGLTHADLVDKLSISPKLGRCIRFLLCAHCSGLVALELSSFWRRMKKLHFMCCEDLEVVKMPMEREGREAVPSPRFAVDQCFYNLNDVFVSGCPKLFDLTWLIYAPNLQSLTVYRCDALEELIGDDYEVSNVKNTLGIFSRLKSLSLSFLTRLRSIYPHALLFPSLQVIDVLGCRMLRSLPFDSNTASNSIKSIVGEAGWWGELEWPDQTIKNIFTPYYRPKMKSDLILHFEKILGGYQQFPTDLDLRILERLSDQFETRMLKDLIPKVNTSS